MRIQGGALAASLYLMRPLTMKHIPVLTKELIENLNPQFNQNFIDGTLGFGGHARLILEKTSPNGKILGIDQDVEALAGARKVLEEFEGRIDLKKANFDDLGLLVRDWEAKEIHGIYFDLGVSTFQLTDEKRGFSFRKNAPLDMRMDQVNNHLTARDVVNKYSEKELAKIIFELGEERSSRQIAAEIVRHRHEKPIETTGDLVEAIRRATPSGYRNALKIHFATKTFQALRIYVNRELENLKNVLPQAVQVLSPGGRIAVISFHSLEDRIVKQFFASNDALEIITKKPIVASAEEISLNPNSRSAKLRVAQKL